MQKHKTPKAKTMLAVRNMKKRTKHSTTQTCKAEHAASDEAGHSSALVFASLSSKP